MLPLNLPELEVSGLALVTAIDDCPPIAGGEGSVVTARFVTREVHVVASVDVLGADGAVETITGTTIHPVWSVDRQEWVPLSELGQGETLQGLDGLAVVLSVSLSRVTQPVYNIEVHGEHVYQVGELGLVVHNAEGLICKTIGEAGELAAGTLGRKKGVASVPDKIDDAARIIYETKNVAYQHLSTQLRDYVEIAARDGRQLILNVRKDLLDGTLGTRFSSSLEDLVKRGVIEVRKVI
ncbi:MAG: putative toxin [Planctomycetota bacterium]|nr:putative toxin [Planctomycetota bacterium]